MTEQETIIDSLLDIDLNNADIMASNIFNKLIEYNNTSVLRFSSYVLSNMWNKSEAVLCGLVQHKTANDFHSNINWKE